MLYKYHQLDKDNNLTELYREDIDEITFIIKFISAKPVVSFFIYQLTGFGDDLSVWVDPYKDWFNSFDHVIGYIKTGFIQNMLLWMMIVPLLLYFGITRFFVCLFKWRKYYRDASLILLKIS